MRVFGWISEDTDSGRCVEPHRTFLRRIFAIVAALTHSAGDCPVTDISLTSLPQARCVHRLERGRRWVGRHRRASAGVTGVRNAPAALQRRCSARGAHVASPMVGGRLKGSPCLQHTDEGHTVVNALGRTSYTPQPKVPPRDFRNPAQSAPESPCPGRGSRCMRQALRTERAYSLSSSFG